MYKALKISDDKSIEKEYKLFKNKLNNLLRYCEKNYYKSLLEANKNNLSKLWKTLNSVINKKKQTKCDIVFKCNNKEITNKEDIANHFNKYYLNVAKDKCKNIPILPDRNPYEFMNNKVVNSLFLAPTNETEISEIISNVKNSSAGYDGTTIKMIKKLKGELLTPLTHIFNLSFSSGTIPDNLKIAKVVPIYKHGDKSLFSSYRPISILPAFSKILEKLAYKRIMHFLDKYDILHDNQFGFRKHRSTEMAIHQQRWPSIH